MKKSNQLSFSWAQKAGLVFSLLLLVAVTVVQSNTEVKSQAQGENFEEHQEENFDERDFKDFKEERGGEGEGFHEAAPDDEERWEDRGQEGQDGQDGQDD